MATNREGRDELVMPCMDPAVNIVLFGNCFIQTTSAGEAGSAPVGTWHPPVHLPEVGDGKLHEDDLRESYNASCCIFCWLPGFVFIWLVLWAFPIQGRIGS